MSYPCLALRTYRRASGYKTRHFHLDGAQCFGQMHLQPVVAQRDEGQMLSYRCDTCGRLAWEFTPDVRSTSEKEPS